MPEGIFWAKVSQSVPNCLTVSPQVEDDTAMVLCGFLDTYSDLTAILLGVNGNGSLCKKQNLCML